MAVNGKKFDFSKLHHFTIDPDKETKGVETYLSHESAPGLTLGIARAGGREFNRHRDAVIEHFRKSIGRRLAPDDEEKRNIEVFAFCVRWFRIDGEDETVQYDRDTMIEMLTTYRYIFESVIVAANETDRYLVDLVDDAKDQAGNA